jgi:TolB-like protein
MTHNGRANIRTIPTVGYKFIADVEEITDTDGLRESRVGDIPEQQSRQNEVVVAAGPSRLTSKRFSRTAFLALAGGCHVSGTGLCYLLLTFFAGCVPLADQINSRHTVQPTGANDRDEALEMGMAESLIARLNNIRQVIVRPLSAVRKYTTLDQDAVAAGREQGVDTVLDGSIQRSGERIRMMVRLVNVEDGKLLWTGQFDEKFTNVFSVQDSISEQVVRALAVTLTGGGKSVIHKSTPPKTRRPISFISWGDTSGLNVQNKD